MTAEEKALEYNWILKERGDANYPDDIIIETFKAGYVEGYTDKMKEYTIYCTKEQTNKALELGAPIETEWHEETMYVGYDRLVIPTAEQMIEWLEEQEEISDLHVFKPATHWTFELYATNGDGKNNHPLFNSRKEATLAAIDAGLEYLSNCGK